MRWNEYASSVESPFEVNCILLADLSPDEAASNAMKTIEASISRLYGNRIRDFRMKAFDPKESRLIEWVAPLTDPVELEYVKVKAAFTRLYILLSERK